MLWIFLTVTHDNLLRERKVPILDNSMILLVFLQTLIISMMKIFLKHLCSFANALKYLEKFAILASTGWVHPIFPHNGVENSGILH